MQQSGSLVQDLISLNQRHGREGISFEAGSNDLITAHLSYEGFKAVIYLLGAQVVSWTGEQTGEHLFLSRQSLFQPGKAIRGGVPLCYPQFAALGALPQHGFARTSLWQVVDSSVGVGGCVSVVLELDDRGGLLWPDHPTSARLTIALGETLDMELKVTNHSVAVIEITHAFHTYFRIGDIAQTRVEGLNGTSFLDKVHESRVEIESRDLIEISEETDRVYMRAPDRLEIRDLARGIVFDVEKTMQQDAVLWNPWKEKSASMKDFGDDEYREMVCLETGNISEPVRIGGGESVIVSQRLSVRKTAQ